MFFNLFGKGKEKEIEEYAAKLSDAVIHDELDGDLLESLIDFAHDKGLGNKQLARAQAMACETVFESFYQDGYMNDEDFAIYSECLEACYMLKEEDKYRFNAIAKRCNAFYKIMEKGLLPTIRKEYAAVDYREGENLHFASAGKLMDPEGTPEPGAGILISAETPFRRSKEEAKAVGWKEREKGKGAFFLTTFRAGFRNKKDGWTLELSDLDCAEIRGNVLCFFLKDGKALAVMLDDYEMAGAVLSNILGRKSAEK